MTNEEAYWRGYYTACRDLSTSPRMTKAQMPAIERAAQLARERLEGFGVEFAAPDAAVEGDAYHGDGRMRLVPSSDTESGPA